MSFIPKNPLIIPEIESSPSTPFAGTRGIFAKKDGWYEVDANGLEQKLTTDADIAKSYQYYGEPSITPSDQSLFTFKVDGKNMTAMIVRDPNTPLEEPLPIKGDIVIPYEYVSTNGSVYSVTEIDTNAFNYASGITSVILPNTVAVVDEYAFCDNTSLKKIKFPDGLITIGTTAFAGCTSLEEVNIPNTVTTIQEKAFQGCSALTSVILPNSLINLGSYAFSECSNLKSVVISGGMTTIRSKTFYLCSNLTSITIPVSVTKIESNAVQACNKLTDIYYAGTNTQWDAIVIGDNAKIDASKKHYGVAPAQVHDIETFVDEAFASAKINALKSYMYYGDENIVPSDRSLFTFVTDDKTMTAIIKAKAKNISGDIVIPYEYVVGDKVYRVTTIGDDAFLAGELTSVVIPHGVTTIRQRAFCECFLLVSVVIPNTVISIEEDAFYSCANITSVSIPDSVTTIGNHAFYSCSNTKSISIGSGVTRIESGAFGMCASIRNVEIPDSVTKIGTGAFYNCNSLTSISIGSGVTRIESGAFDKVDLTTIYFKSTKTQWENIEIHEDNESLFKAKIYYEWIPATKGYVDDKIVGNDVDLSALMAHYGDVSVVPSSQDLFKFEIDASQKTAKIIGNYDDIEGYLPSDIYGDVVIPYEYKIADSDNAGVYKVTGIGIRAFYRSSITNIRIPNTITTIEDYAFNECYELQSITFPESVITIGSGLCKGDTSLRSVYFKGSIDTISESACWGCGLLEVALPEGVRTIDGSAFRENYDLENITMPISLKTVELNAFMSCDSIKDVWYKGSAEKWAEITFESGNEKITSSVHFNCVPATKGYVDEEISKIPDTDGELSEASVNPIQNKVITKKVNELQAVVYYGDPNISPSNPSLFTFETSTGTITGYSGLDTDIVIPYEINGTKVVSIGDAAFFECITLTSVIIPRSVTSIGNSAFYFCKALRSAIIPNSVKSIGNDAFGECFNLRSIEIPDSVTSIGNYAFAYCENLTSITIPLSVISIGDNVFESCHALKNVTIEEGVKTLGSTVFTDCTSLTNIKIPNSVTNIGGDLFMSIPTSNFTVTCGTNSCTETYCKDNNINYVLDTVNSTLESEIASLKEIINLLQAKSLVKTITINLPASKWVGEGNKYSQVVSIVDITPYSKVDLQPTTEQLLIFYEKDITFVTENDGGVITVYCIGQKPTNNYEIQATITEVDRDE